MNTYITIKRHINVATFQQYISKRNVPVRSQYWGSGMSIEGELRILLTNCFESSIGLEELIMNVDIDEIDDFPYWSTSLTLIMHPKILELAYEYMFTVYGNKVRARPINWERIATHWLRLLGGDTVTERQALFALFALPAVKVLEEVNPVRIAWEKRLEEIWAKHKPKLPVRATWDNMYSANAVQERWLNPGLSIATRADVTYTPDSSKYDISTPYDHLSYYKQEEIDEKIRRKKAAFYDYEDDQSTNTISFKQ